MMSFWPNFCVNNRLFIVIVVISNILNVCYSQADLLFPSYLNEYEKAELAIQDFLKSKPFLKEAISKLEKTDFVNQYKLADAENNEDKFLNITGLVANHGFKLETYHVQTEDGYIIAVYRIPRGGEPVLLVHGLLNSAIDWFTIGRDSALPYILADQGYDVWLISARGATEDSKGHVCLSPKNNPEKYWDFSFDEIGRYDLPATIDLVLKTTRISKLKCVGFSQGTTVLFEMASELPAYKDKISLIVALSPITWLSHMINPLLSIIAVLGDTFTVFLRKGLGFYVFDSNNPIIQFIVKAVCGNTEGASLICSNIMFLSSGFDYEQLNFTRLPVIFAHTPSSVSTKQLAHYAQLYDSGKFRRYDHGAEKNLIKYGTEVPPDYPVDKIDIPVALFYKRDTDWLSAYEDVMTLKQKLKRVVDFYEVPQAQWCHTDYCYGKDVKHLVYDRILKLVKKY